MAPLVVPRGVSISQEHAIRRSRMRDLPLNQPPGEHLLPPIKENLKTNENQIHSRIDSFTPILTHAERLVKSNNLFEFIYFFTKNFQFLLFLSTKVWIVFCCSFT